MVIDTSALIAILLDEPDAPAVERDEPLLFKGHDFEKTDVPR